MFFCFSNSTESKLCKIVILFIIDNLVNLLFVLYRRIRYIKILLYISSVPVLYIGVSIFCLGRLPYKYDILKWKDFLN